MKTVQSAVSEREKALKSNRDRHSKDHAQAETKVGRQSKSEEPGAGSIHARPEHKETKRQRTQYSTTERIQGSVRSHYPIPETTRARRYPNLDAEHRRHPGAEHSQQYANTDLTTQLPDPRLASQSTIHI